MNTYAVCKKHDSTIKIKQNLQQITFNSIKHFMSPSKTSPLCWFVTCLSRTRVRRAWSIPKPMRWWGRSNWRSRFWCCPSGTQPWNLVAVEVHREPEKTHLNVTRTAAILLLDTNIFVEWFLINKAQILQQGSFCTENFVEIQKLSLNKCTWTWNFAPMMSVMLRGSRVRGGKTWIGIGVELQKKNS